MGLRNSSIGAKLLVYSPPPRGRRLTAPAAASADVKTCQPELATRRIFPVNLSGLAECRATPTGGRWIRKCSCRQALGSSSSRYSYATRLCT